MVELEDERGVARERRVDEGSVLEVERVLLVDGVSGLGLAALVILDLVSHLERRGD